MKHGNLPHIGLVGTAVLLLLGTALADVIHLKDGRRLEGSILTEGEDSYLVEVQVTPSIKEEITIAKKDIRRIEREQPDHTAFAEIAVLVPVPDLLTADDYEQRIQKIRAFISDFPDSQLLDEVNEILNTHLAELKAVEAGGIKFDSELIPSGNRLANAYQIESQVAEREIRRLISESNLLRALRAFHAFEEELSGSQVWHSMLPLMRQVAATHQARAAEMIEEYEGRMARQETGLSRMGREERQTSVRAIAERDAALKERHDQERAIRGYWLSLNPYYKPSMEETIRFAEQEMRRLETAATQTPSEPTPSELWRDAIAAIQSGESSEITAAITAARSARMSERHLNQLQELASKTE